LFAVVDFLAADFLEADRFLAAAFAVFLAGLEVLAGARATVWASAAARLAALSIAFDSRPLVSVVSSRSDLAYSRLIRVNSRTYSAYSLPTV
jgi:hypothetical protein